MVVRYITHVYVRSWSHIPTRPEPCISYRLRYAREETDRDRPSMATGQLGKPMMTF